VIDATGSVIATGTILSVNTWYRVEIRWSYSSSSDWEVFLNGVSDMSGTGANFDGSAGADTTFNVGLTGQGGAGILANPTTTYFDNLVFQDQCPNDTTAFLGNWGTRTFRIGNTGTTPDCDSVGTAGGDTLTSGTWDDISDGGLGQPQYGSGLNGAVVLDDTDTFGVPGPRLAISISSIVKAGKWYGRFRPSDGPDFIVYGRLEGTSGFQVSTDQFVGGLYHNKTETSGVDFPRRVPYPDEYFILGFSNGGAVSNLIFAEGWASVLLNAPISDYAAPTVWMKGNTLVKGNTLIK
jgi:hypothetical protein